MCFSFFIFSLSRGPISIASWWFSMNFVERHHNGWSSWCSIIRNFPLPLCVLAALDRLSAAGCFSSFFAAACLHSSLELQCCLMINIPSFGSRYQRRTSVDIAVASNSRSRSIIQTVCRTLLCSWNPKLNVQASPKWKKRREKQFVFFFVTQLTDKTQICKQIDAV